MRGGVQWVCALLASFLIAGTSGEGNLCEWCSCRDKVVHCECTTPDQELHLERSDVGTLDVQKLSVQGCKKLIFGQSAFANVENLQTLSVHSVGELSVPLGVFSSLNSLVVEDVSSFLFGERAFQGVHLIQNILIRRTTIPHLPPMALYGITDLQSFLLERVTINSIDTKAVFLKMRYGGSEVRLTNCTIKKLQKNSFLVKGVNSFKMTNTTIEYAEPASIKVQSRQFATLNRNTLMSHTNEYALQVQSPSVNISDNHIEHLTIGFLKSFNSTIHPLIFVGNTVNNISIEENQTSSAVILIKRNIFPCKCTYRPLLIPLRENFCLRTCHQTIEEYLQMCDNAASPRYDSLESTCNENLATTEKDIPEMSVEQSSIPPIGVIAAQESLNLTDYNKASPTLTPVLVLLVIITVLEIIDHCCIGK